MKIQILILANIIAVFSWGGSLSRAATPQTNQAPPDQHTSQNSLDWDGTYAGVLPCADCEGIEIDLTINENNTYILRTRYLGKGDKVFEHQGTFTWGKNGSVIYLKGLTGSPNRYFVGENQLFQLNMQGERITGKLADKYILRKTAKSASSS